MNTATAMATAVAEATVLSTAQPASLSEVMRDNWWYFAILALFFAFLTFLQVLFSKSESKTSGLILPGISFGSAFLAAFFPAMFSTTMDFMQGLKVFLVVSVPAFFWLIVYVIVRIVVRKKK
ncbi:MAG: hypothetical protein IJO48_05625 [Clostridia bacterium]|nr:hypothetical protein [Clostridia bacterium]